GEAALAEAASTAPTKNTVTLIPSFRPTIVRTSRLRINTCQRALKAEPNPATPRIANYEPLHTITTARRARARSQRRLIVGRCPRLAEDAQRAQNDPLTGSSTPHLAPASDQVR